MKKQRVEVSGVSLVGLLTTLFITLKLTDHIDWPWFWVLSPLWVSALLVVLILVFIMLVVFLITWLAFKEQKNP